jgi:hypothetical protein
MITFRCIGVDVAVTAEPQCLAAQFAGLYHGCTPTAGSTRPQLELEFRRAAGTYSLRADGVAIAISSNVRDVFARASVEVDRASVAASSREYLLIHASCVARGSRAALIVGPSGAGKSTLAAALTRAGAEYVGDEVIGVYADGRAIAAYPKPLKLDGHARRLLGAGSDGTPGEELLAGAAFGPVRSVRRCVRPALIVMPAPGTSTTADVVPLPRADVAELLADQCFNFPTWGARGLVTITEIARACPGVRLRFGDLGAAVAAVDEWLQ